MKDSDENYPSARCVPRHEASIALFVTSHCATKNCDHFVDLCKSKIKDSKCLNDVQLHRSK